MIIVCFTGPENSLRHCAYLFRLYNNVVVAVVHCRYLNSKYLVRWFPLDVHCLTWCHHQCQIIIIMYLYAGISCKKNFSCLFCRSFLVFLFLNMCNFVNNSVLLFSVDWCNTMHVLRAPSRKYFVFVQMGNRCSNYSTTGNGNSPPPFIVIIVQK